MPRSSTTSFSTTRSSDARHTPEGQPLPSAKAAMPAGSAGMPLMSKPGRVDAALRPGAPAAAAAAPSGSALERRSVQWRRWRSWMGKPPARGGGGGAGGAAPSAARARGPRRGARRRRSARAAAPGVGSPRRRRPRTPHDALQHAPRRGGLEGREEPEAAEVERHQRRHAAVAEHVARPQHGAVAAEDDDKVERVGQRLGQVVACARGGGGGAGGRGRGAGGRRNRRRRRPPAGAARAGRGRGARAGAAGGGGAPRRHGAPGAPGSTAHVRSSPGGAPPPLLPSRPWPASAKLTDGAPPLSGRAPRGTPPSLTLMPAACCCAPPPPPPAAAAAAAAASCCCCACRRAAASPAAAPRAALCASARALTSANTLGSTCTLTWCSLARGHACEGAGGRNALAADVSGRRVCWQAARARCARGAQARRRARLTAATRRRPGRCPRSTQPACA